MCRANNATLAAPGDRKTHKEEDLEGKELTVFTLSGEATRLRVPTSHTAADMEQRLEPKLGIPAFLQRLLDGSEELADEAVVTGIQ